MPRFMTQEAPHEAVFAKLVESLPWGRGALLVK